MFGLAKQLPLLALAFLFLAGVSGDSFECGETPEAALPTDTVDFYWEFRVDGDQVSCDAAGVDYLEIQMNVGGTLSSTRSDNCPLGRHTFSIAEGRSASGEFQAFSSEGDLIMKLEFYNRGKGDHDFVFNL
jgi:hypothetical protein